MALDPTLREFLYKRSVRKYFIDLLETIYGKAVYFDRQYSIPKDEQGEDIENWIVVYFNGIKIDTMSTGMLEVYCYSRNDPGNQNLSVTRDQVVALFVDTDMSDGMARIPYYDDHWDEIGAMLGQVDSRSGVQVGADGTSAQMVNVNLRWGTK